MKTARNTLVKSQKTEGRILKSILLSNVCCLKSPDKGFTLVEILVGLTILATLAGGVIFTLNPAKQINKSRDAQRQSDLQQIRTAIDSFYNDNECYPQQIPFGHEWRVSNTIYMKKVPQDNSCQGGTGACYRLRTDRSSACPQWNVIFAKLSDDSINENACPLSTLSQCTPPGYEEGKWACVMSGSVDCGALASAPTLIGGEETVEPTASPAPTQAPTAGPIATPTPTTPLVSGSVTYAIGNSAGTNPDIYEVTMMPLWQTYGNAQQIRAKIDDALADVTAVSVVLYSDNEARKFTLTLTTGTPRSGTWTGTWQVADTYNEQYGIDITARDSAGNTQTERLIFR